MTIVEVMVAVLVLLVGLLGVLLLVDTSNVQTTKTRAREGATNLAREILENARALEYFELDSGQIVPALQNRPNLADSATGSPGWTLERRGTVYTVTASTCIYDDAKDNVNVAAHTAAFCSSSGTAPAAGVTKAESNPDDFRRVDLTIQWTVRGQSVSSTASALIINPTGSFGPRLANFSALDGTQQINVLVPTVSQVSFKATAQPSAAAVHWDASDGDSEGDGTSSDGGKNWLMTWNLKPLTATDHVLDGTYQVRGQAFDTVGIPGDSRLVTVVVDRRAPAAPSGVEAGRNDRLAGTPIVEIDWLPLNERDIVGYTVGRVSVAGGPETIVCDVEGSTTTACIDDEPLAVEAQYHVHGVDAGRYGQGTSSTAVTVSQTATSPPVFPAGATVSLLADGTLTWTPADGAVSFYRIYHNGTALANRIGATSTSAATYAVQGELSGTYYVTAVNNTFSESQPLGPENAP